MAELLRALRQVVSGAGLAVEAAHRWATVPDMSEDHVEPTIAAVPGGPFVVSGGVDLYRRRAVHSEHGEPLTWETTERLDGGARTLLCRCGQSERKPFCDGTHNML